VFLRDLRIERGTLMDVLMNGARVKVATACAWLTLAGNVFFFVLRRLETIEADQCRLQTAVEHRLTAIETKLDRLLTQQSARR
jgi:hypothetical protein